MWVVLIDSSKASGKESFSATNPATSAALELKNIPTPPLTQPGEILIEVKASTIIRDTLTWPEMYSGPDRVPGHDFSGVVVSTFDSKSTFNPGDEVFGMAHADRGGCWAEKTIVLANEVAIKPPSLSWAEAAAVPLSALTAWQALFDQAGIPEPDFTSNPTAKASDKSHKGQKSLLITGASGGVGLYLLQLAALTSYQVFAATRSKSDIESFLLEQGADTVITYDDLASKSPQFDVIIDTVGGSILEKCWSYAKSGATLVTIDSASYDFLNQHRESGLTKDGVNAIFFIVTSSGSQLSKISKVIEKGLLRSFVADTYPLNKAKEAYDRCHTRGVGRGKIVLIM